MQYSSRLAWTIGLVCFGAGIGGAQQMPVMPFVAQVQTSPVVGVTAGQTAQLNALNPGVPAPLATGAKCPAHVSFLDDQGTVLKSTDVTVEPGKSVSFDLNRDTEVQSTAQRMQIRAVISMTPPTPVTTTTPTTVTGGFASFVMTASLCPLVPSLEVVDNSTSKTQLVVTDFHALPYPLLGGTLIPAGPAR